jgi:hypothetical protein
MPRRLLFVALLCECSPSGLFFVFGFFCFGFVAVALCAMMMPNALLRKGTRAISPVLLFLLLSPCGG